MELEDAVGLEIMSSTGGGAGGHTIEVRARERNGDKFLVLRTRATGDAARQLARATIEAVGLLDDIHVERCPYCRPHDR